jgi:hypothetical protein
MAILVYDTWPDGKPRTDAYGMAMYKETPRTPPEGRVEGALKRDDCPGDLGPLYKDAFPKEIVNVEDWPGLIQEGAGDHRKYVKWILDQDGRGSCASEGLANCITQQRHRRGLPEVKLNPWPNYYRISNGRDNGSTLSGNIRFAKEHGFLPMDLWPRYGPNGHAWSDIPRSSDPLWQEAKKYKPGEVYDIGNTVEAASALFAGHSVYAAYPGHAWQLIAVINTQQGIWLNSWSEQWGDGGFGVINFSRLTYQYGLYAIQTTSTGD